MGRTGVEENPVRKASESFESFDADDPTGLLGSITLDADYDTEEHTREPGLDLSLAVPPSRPPAPSPELTAFQGKVAKLKPDDLGGEYSNTATLGRSARRAASAGRESLGDFWTFVKRDLLVTAQAKSPNDPVLAKAQSIVDNDTDWVAALARWRRASIAGTVDFKELGDAATDVMNSYDVLAAQLEAVAPTVDQISQEIGGLQVELWAIRKEIEDEGKLLASGGRVSATTPGEAVRRRFEAATADGRFLSTITQNPNWNNIGLVVLRRLGRLQDKPVAPKMSFAADRVTDAMTGLDAALKFRTTANADPVKAAQGVYDAYETAVYTLNEQIRLIRSRATNLQAGSKDPGWNAEQCGQSLDAIYGLVRALQGDLAADDVASDATHGSSAQALLVDLNGLSGPTTLEQQANQFRKDPRAFWAKTSKQEMAALKKLKVDLSGDLKTQGLGPLLDKWVAERDAFPQQDRQKMHDLAVRIGDALRTYRLALRKVVAKNASPNGLANALDVAGTIVALDLRSFGSRGGLFG